MFRKFAAVAAVVTVGLGASATGASAYAFTGGSYVATASTSHTIGIGGITTHACSNVTYSGTAAGADSTTFTPAFSGCSFSGYSASAVQSGPWTLAITGSTTTSSSTSYSVSLEIPAGTTTTLVTPSWGYTLTIPGPQTIANAGTMMNKPGGALLNMSWSNGAWAAYGGPFPPSGTNLLYRTNASMFLPGVTIS